MSSTLNSRNIAQNSIEIIEQMQKWIAGICGILQDRDTAYQIVCDYYKRGINTTKPSKNRIERMKKLNTMRERVRQEVLELVLSER